MIYGLNFGGPAIPTTPRTAFSKFKRRIKVPNNPAELGTPFRSWKSGWLVYYLAGIGQSKAERDTMLVIANNGHRRLHVEAKQTAGGFWYGIYVY